MRLNYLCGLFAISALLSFSGNTFSQADIFDATFIADIGSGDNLQSVSGIDGHYYGFFKVGDTYLIKGGEVHTSKTDASGNVCSAAMNYRIYKECETAGAFLSFPLGFCCDQLATDCEGGSCSVPTGAVGTTNQKWKRSTESIDLLSGLSKGDYILELFFSATGSTVNNSGASENIDIARLSTGIYELELVANGRQLYTAKIMK